MFFTESLQENGFFQSETQQVRAG